MKLGRTIEKRINLRTETVK